MLKTILPQLETAKNPSFSTGNIFKKTPKEGKKSNFSKSFLKKVRGKSHSAENLEQSFMLAKRFILGEN